MTPSSIRPFYADWSLYHDHVLELVRGMSGDELAIRPAPESWPIWATLGHMAGVRVFWLCYVIGEPGIETTPWGDPAQAGWEEDLDRPRGAGELIEALTTTWAILDRCLDSWTPEMLTETFSVVSPGGMRVHTRQSILLRLLSHDAYHAGQLSQTLGIVGLPQIDLWPAEDHPLR